MIRFPLSISRRVTRIGVASVAAVAACGTVALTPASADTLVSQLPGASADGTVVVTDSPRVKVDVEAADAASGTVKVTVKNTYDHKFRCAAPGAAPKDSKPAELPNAVATADIVSQAVSYYREQPFSPKDGVAAPILGVVPTTPFLKYVPAGSLGRLFGKDIATRASLARQWDSARLAGHTAELAPFDLEPLATQEFTVKLNAPGNGERTEFAAGALLYCTDVTADPKQSYIFAGYQPGAKPAPATAGSSRPAGSAPSSLLGSSSR